MNSVRKTVAPSLLVALATLACDEQPSVPLVESVATTVTVSPDTASLTALEMTAQFIAEVQDQHGWVIDDAPVIWSSGNERVVSVDGSGLATAVGNGTGQVVARSGGASGTALLTVQQQPVALMLSPSVDTLVAPGDTLRLAAGALDANGHEMSPPALTWTSRSQFIATVDSTGLVTATGPGLVEIFASTWGADDRQLTASATILVEAAPTVIIQAPTTESSFSTVDSQVTLSGVAYHDRTIMSVTWSVPNGSRGPAQGIENWTAGPIPVDAGTTQVVVTATDALGNQGSDTLQIIRNAAVRFLGPPQFDPDILAVSASSHRFGIQIAIEPIDAFDLTEVVLVQIDEQGADLGVRIPLNDEDDDGVYSGSHTLVPPPPTPGFRYYRASARGYLDGNLVQDESAVASLEIVEPATVAEVDNIIDVQALALDSAGRVLASTGDMSVAILDVVDLLRNHPDVAAVERTGDTSINLTYTSGLTGGIVFAYADSTGAVTTRGAQATVATNAHPSDWHGQYGGAMPSRRDNVSHGRGQSLLAGEPDPLPGAQSAPPYSNFVPNHRAVIYEPYAQEFAEHGSAEGDTIAKLLTHKGIGMDVTRFKDSDATVHNFASMTDYGLVVIATHGEAGNLILTGEPVTQESIERYAVSTKARELGVVTRVVVDSVSLRHRKNRWAITSGFVARLRGKFPRSIVINNSCESTQTDRLQYAFLSKGAGTYFGYDKDVSSRFAYEQVIRIVAELDAGRTAAQAFAGGGIDPYLEYRAEFQMRGNGMMRFARERAALVAILDGLNSGTTVSGVDTTFVWGSDESHHCDWVNASCPNGILRELRYRPRVVAHLPPEIGELAHLEVLVLNRPFNRPWTGRLVGAIPREIGDLSRLRYLDLENNQLTGSIPRWLGNLSRLEHALLNDNQLTSSIPSLGNLSTLRLRVHYNQLTGCIPREMGWVNGRVARGGRVNPQGVRRIGAMTWWLEPC